MINLSDLDRLLETFFHLPTLIVLALAGLGLLVGLYDLGLELDHGLIRLYTNRGNLSLYWLNGCCDLSW